MQTFLPYPDFEESAKCLDNLRLNKQIIEASQILNVLNGKSSGWKNHPAIKMWSTYEGALYHYMQTCNIERMNRGRGSHASARKIDIIEFKSYPNWLGNEKFHASHRSALLLKGEIDRIRKRIKDAKLIISKNLILRNLNMCDVNDLDLLCDNFNISYGINYYKQFKWKELPKRNYVWPTN